MPISLAIILRVEEEGGGGVLAYLHSYFSSADHDRGGGGEFWPPNPPYYLPLYSEDAYTFAPCTAGGEQNFTTSFTLIGNEIQTINVSLMVEFEDREVDSTLNETYSGQVTTRAPYPNIVLVNNTVVIVIVDDGEYILYYLEW